MGPGADEYCSNLEREQIEAQNEAYKGDMADYYGGIDE